MADVGQRDAALQLVWAWRVARELLEPLGERWQHTLGVVRQADRVRLVLDRVDGEVLVGAALLHDVGYARSLEETGFHPLDGARFVREHGYERLAGLVAFHSGARFEAEERGLLGQLEAFRDERSVVSRALSYCDLTTGPDGECVTVTARLAGVRERWGSGSPQVRALGLAEPALLADVHAIETLLSSEGAR